MYLRRSRFLKLIALDLRAKMGANNVAQERLTQLIDKYGPRVVKAVMKKMMHDAEKRLRAKLSSLPDGTWGAVAHRDGARAGDTNIYKVVLQMTKREDKLIFDFSGTDPEVEGFINCTFAGLRGGIMTVALTMLCNDIPWAPGGIYRCIETVSEPGAINNCNFPAGIGKASVASAWATQNAVSECIAQMLGTHPTHKKAAMSCCQGTWDLALLAGVDQRGGPFVTMLCDPMAGGLGARVIRTVSTPVGRMASRWAVSPMWKSTSSVFRCFISGDAKKLILAGRVVTAAVLVDPAVLLCTTLRLVKCISWFQHRAKRFL